VNDTLSEKKWEGVSLMRNRLKQKLNMQGKKKLFLVARVVVIQKTLPPVCIGLFTQLFS